MSKRQIIKEKRKKRARVNRFLTILAILVVVGLITTFFILNGQRALPTRTIIDGLTAGDPNAPIEVVEYADFQCVACQNTFVIVEPDLVRKYINTGKVFFTYEPFSFLGPESYRAAQAAYCAADQNKFWEYHDLLFENWAGENQGAFSDNNLFRFAEQIDFDKETFKTCFDSGKYIQKVIEKAQAASAAGITSTPTFLVNGQRVNSIVLLDELARLSGE